MGVMSVTREQDAYVYALSTIPGVGPSRLRRVIGAFPTADAFASAQYQDLAALLGEQAAHDIQRRRDTGQWEADLDSARRQLEAWLAQGIATVTLASPNYSPLLRLIPDPPPVLYARGKLELLKNRNAIAVVGTRRPTPLGKEIARRVASHFAGLGYVIVSGLAKGIDSEAHRGALAAGGHTIAVLGTPIDKIYPATNRSLAIQILERDGLLISEHAPGTKTGRHAFIRRDRIQSGLSLAVIPIQTDIKGGTMHTVRFAQAQGRLLFCPRPLDPEMSAPQLAGIKMLLETKQAEPFDRNDYEVIHNRLQEFAQELLKDDTTSIT